MHHRLSDTPHRRLFATALGFVFGAACATANEPRPAGPPAAIKPVYGRWVEELGSSDYHRRVEATRALAAAGAPAISALERSTRWNDAEASGRALTILSTLADVDDSVIRERALGALRRLAGSDQHRAAERAGRLLEQARRRTVWLIETAGGTVEFADSRGEQISGVHLQRCSAGAAIFRRLGRIGALERLNLASCNVDDAAIERVATLTGLKYLNLQSNPLTDKALPHLAGSKNLEALYLSGARITSRGVVHLRSLPRLRVLWLTHTEIDDECLPVLEAMRGLRHLRLTGSGITHAGCQRLRRSLPETRITW